MYALSAMGKCYFHASLPDNKYLPMLIGQTPIHQQNYHSRCLELTNKEGAWNIPSTGLVVWIVKVGNDSVHTAKSVWGLLLFLTITRSQRHKNPLREQQKLHTRPLTSACHILSALCLDHSFAFLVDRQLQQHCSCLCLKRACVALCSWPWLSKDWHRREWRCS